MRSSVRVFVMTKLALNVEATSYQRYIVSKTLLFKTNDVVSLRFVKILNITISNMPIFLWKKIERLLQCKSFSHFFNKKFQCIWLLSRETLINELTS